MDSFPKKPQVDLLPGCGDGRKCPSNLSEPILYDSIAGWLNFAKESIRDQWVPNCQHCTHSGYFGAEMFHGLEANKFLSTLSPPGSSDTLALGQSQIHHSRTSIKAVYQSFYIVHSPSVQIISDPSPIVTLSSHIRDGFKWNIIILIDEHLKLSDTDPKIGFVETVLKE